MNDFNFADAFKIIIIITMRAVRYLFNCTVLFIVNDFNFTHTCDEIIIITIRVFLNALISIVYAFISLKFHCHYLLLFI